MTHDHTCHLTIIYSSNDSTISFPSFKISLMTSIIPYTHMTHHSLEDVISLPHLRTSSKKEWVCGENRDESHKVAFCNGCIVSKCLLIMSSLCTRMTNTIVIVYLSNLEFLWLCTHPWTPAPSRSRMTIVEAYLLTIRRLTLKFKVLYQAHLELTM